MSDCLSAGLSSHNFKDFRTQRCIDCNLRLADFVAWSIADALHSERARLAGLVRGLKNNSSSWVALHGKPEVRYVQLFDVLALLEGEEG